MTSWRQRFSTASGCTVGQADVGSPERVVVPLLRRQSLSSDCIGMLVINQAKRFPISTGRPKAWPVDGLAEGKGVGCQILATTWLLHAVLCCCRRQSILIQPMSSASNWLIQWSQDWAAPKPSGRGGKTYGSNAACTIAEHDFVSQNRHRVITKMRPLWPILIVAATGKAYAV